jgi:hypothetical protein
MRKIALATAVFVHYAALAVATPMFRGIYERFSYRKNSVHAAKSIEELAQLDVSELCNIIKTKDALIEIFRRKTPLISKVFHSEYEAPDMCFGVHVAMRNNWIDLVEEYFRLDHCKFHLDRTNMAIWGSHLAYFEHRMKGMSGNRYQEFFDHAAKNGYLHMLQADLEGINGSPDAMDWAAFNGHIAVVKWLHDEQRMRNDKNEKTGCSESAMAHAAIGNMFEIVQYLFEHCHDDNDIKQAISNARCLDHEDILGYLLARSSKIVSISTNGKY